MKNHLLTHVSLTLVFGLSAMLSLSCAKKRDASLPEDQVAGTFSVAELQSAQIKVKTREAKAPAVKSQSLLGSQNGVLTIDTQGIPDRFLFLFRNLEISGTKAEDLEIFFGVDRAFVTAYKLVQNEKMNVIEKSLALNSENSKDKAIQKSIKLPITLKNSSSLVPLFRFKVLAHGTLEKVKNELKEETSVLKLKKSEWDVSTHVQISDVSHERLNIEIDSAVAAESDAYIISDTLKNKVFSRAELSEILKVEIPKTEKEMTYKVSVEENLLKVLPVIEKEADKTEPVLSLNIESLNAQLNMEKGQETNTIIFKKVDANQKGQLVKIIKDTPTK